MQQNQTTSSGCANRRSANLIENMNSSQCRNIGKLFLLGALLLWSVPGINAQNVRSAEKEAECTNIQPLQPNATAGEPDSLLWASDSLPLHLPALSSYRAQPARYPLDWTWTGISDWELHSGFNASLTMGVTCSLGKNRFPGVAFGTGLAGMYAFPVTPRFTVAAGGFLNHITWQGRGGVDFGFSGLAGYQLTDKISIYAYGSKTLVRNAFCPPFLYDDYYTNRLGGMIHFNVTDNFSFSVSVEEQK